MALVLVLEGLLRIIAPGLWRWMSTEMIRLQDQEVRFFGLCCVRAGLLRWRAVT